MHGVQTVADAIAEQLIEWKVKAVFGVPGSSFLPILEALRRREDRIRWVTVRNEETAAFMASGYARLTGRLGVCFGQSGPGAAHLVNGLYDAKKDGAPVLAVTGEVSRKHMHTHYQQTSAPEVLFADCTGYNTLAASPEATIPLLTRAMKEALAGPTSAQISIPEDVQMAPVVHQPFPYEPWLLSLPEPETEDVEQLAGFLKSAERPLIQAGRGVRQAGDRVLQLAEAAGAGVLVSLPAKGLVDETHPLVLGVLGEAGNPVAQKAMESADAVLILGSTWWPQDFTPPGLPAAKVDIRPMAIDGRPVTRAAVVADLSRLLPRLVSAVSTEGQARNRQDWVAGIAQWKEEFRSEVKREEMGDAWPLHPERLMRALQQAMPDRARIAVDVGSHTLWFGRSFEARAGQEVILSGWWRAVGSGLPLALGAKMADPRRPVVAVIGDGGLGMLMGELATAAQEKLPVTIFVVNNRAYGEERDKQLKMGLDPFGTRLANPDFSAVAKASGIGGYRLKRQDDLVAVLRRAVERTESQHNATLLDLPTRLIRPPYLHKGARQEVLARV